MKLKSLIVSFLIACLLVNSVQGVEAALFLTPLPSLGLRSFSVNQEKMRLEVEALTLQAIDSKPLLARAHTFPFVSKFLVRFNRDDEMRPVRQMYAITGVVAAAILVARLWGWAPDSRLMMACGNIGLLLKRRSGENKILPLWTREFLEKAGHATRIRGEQAAGRVIFASDGSYVQPVRKRIVNRKRHTLPVAFRAAFNRSLFAAVLWKGLKAPPATHLVLEHYRYGTSSAPAVKETHPHQWLPEREVRYWSEQNGRWSERPVALATYITHNGDFEEWGIFGAFHRLEILTPWLEKVLGHSHSLKGDSPKIAGMMDLLMTQGLPDASARLAYQLAAATSLNDTPLSSGEIDKVAGFLENIIKQGDPEETWADSLAMALESDPVLLRRFHGHEAAFTRTMVHAFLHNDLDTATRLFMRGARGTFMLAVASTLYPDKVVLASFGQPSSVGFHPEADLVAYASEADALKVSLNHEKGDIPYRLDMDPNGGEILELGADTVRLYSLREDRELTEDEVLSRLVPLSENPYVTPLPKLPSTDPVGYDLQDTSRVLKAIHQDWAEAGSLNRQTAADFSSLVADQLRDPDRKDAIDIFIPAIENSLWLAEAFAGELRKAFPRLRVATASANKVLKALEDVTNTPHGFHLQMDDLGRLYEINEHTITLSISQSAQTFGSLNTVAALQPLYSRNGKNRLFVMSGTLDSLMASAIGQKFTRDAPFSRRIFTNGSGRRPAEPSTVAVNAARMTLNELFTHLARDIQRQLPSEVSLTPDELEAHEREIARWVERVPPALTGHDVKGNPFDSPTHQKLVEQGSKWANHVLEPIKTVAISAIFLFVVYVLAWPLVPSALLNPVLSSFGTFGSLAARSVDWLLFISLSWVLALGLRSPWLENRIGWARLGKRTLVIVDVPYVHQALRAYVSRLFSLSFGHASLDIHSASADHVIHRHAQDVVRGTLEYLGVPDGRLRWLRNDESAVRMVGAQSKGIRNFDVGAEVVAVGAHVAFNPNQMDVAISLRSGPHADPLSERRFPQELLESQLGAFERLIAGQVLFWAMAKKVSSFWPLHFDMSRTQSGTRVSTTRSPYPAPHLAQAPHASFFPQIRPSPTHPPHQIKTLIDRVENPGVSAGLFLLGGLVLVLILTGGASFPTAVAQAGVFFLPLGRRFPRRTHYQAYLQRST